MSQNLIGNVVTKQVSIDIVVDDNLSGAIACQGLILIGIELPAAWTTSNITFQGTAIVAHEDAVAADYKDLVDEDNALITWTAVAQNQIILTLPATPMILGVTSLRINSVTAQAANRTLTLIFGVPKS